MLECRDVFKFRCTRHGVSLGEVGSDQEAYMNWRVETGMLDLIGPFMAGPPSIVHLHAED